MAKNKIFRVSSFAYHVGNQEYKPYVYPEAEYVVDDSSFVPIAEAIKQLGNGASIGSKADLNYDFPDGKDNGQAIPFSRSAQFKDIAELSTEVHNQVVEINNELERVKKEEEFRNQVASELEPSTSSSDSP